MKKYCLLVLALFSQVTLACNSGAIIISRETGFGFSSSGTHNSNINQNVNVPVFVDGKSGCWEQRGGLGFNVEEKKREMSITVPKAKFKNIPNARIDSYAVIERHENNLYASIATFVCSGESVLSVEAFEGSVMEAKALQRISTRSSTVLATGTAASHLAANRDSLLRLYGKRSELPVAFEKYLEESLQGNWGEIERHSIERPSVYLGASMRTPLSSLDASYSTVVATKAGCSKEFRALMSAFRFEKLQVPEGVSAKYRRGKLELTW